MWQEGSKTEEGPHARVRDKVRKTVTRHGDAEGVRTCGSMRTALIERRAKNLVLKEGGGFITRKTTGRACHISFANVKN